MNSLLLIVSFVAATNAAPQNYPGANILKYAFDTFADGYNYLFESSDGTRKRESARTENTGTDDESLVVMGSYSYVDSNGEQNTVFYTADKDGFHPEGDHLVESADVKRTPPLGICDAALASLCGG